MRSKNPPPPVLVIGLGHPDRGDDRIGLLVAEAVNDKGLEGVTVTIRRADMVGLIDEWRGFERVILVDAAAPVRVPGHIHRIESVGGALETAATLASSHSTSVAETLALAHALDRAPKNLTIYAIEGASFALGAPLSPDVKASLDPAIARICAEISAHQAEPSD